MTRTRRADAVRNARAVLDAAGELFAERGPDVALDEIARRAGVGNATLYRHFPTREDLLAAVYADELTALCEHGAALPDAPDAGGALLDWLARFVEHVTTKRALAHAGTAGSADRRSELFAHWHDSMRSTAAALLTRAVDAGAVRPGTTADDVLTLANATAMAATDAPQAKRLLRLAWHGVALMP